LPPGRACRIGVPMMESEWEGAAGPEGARRIVSVELPGDRGYDIFIGPGLLYRVGELMPLPVEGRAAFVITDANAHPYARTVSGALSAAGAGPVHTLTLPPGEGSKSFTHLQKIVDWLLERRVRRTTPVVAVGGGVVGDVAGFAAAVTLRGLPLIQVPTTLLAQVDSAVGGKTGINIPAGKNLVGAFHQPSAVMADTAALASLPPRQMRAGYAEVLKYALIEDVELFEWLEENGHAVLRQDPGALSHAVAASCAAKAAIVGQDERETEGGQRALLNFGHTFGHALEAACGYDERILHGEAVAVGMAIAMDVSARLGLLAAAERERALAHMSALGLPTLCSEISDLDADVETLLRLMQADKKASGTGALRFVLLQGIGQAFVQEGVDEAVLRAALGASLGGAA
jgi:3-dehydroquinate synthase